MCLKMKLRVNLGKRKVMRCWRGEDGRKIIILDDEFIGGSEMWLRWALWKFSVKTFYMINYFHVIFLLSPLLSNKL